MIFIFSSTVDAKSEEATKMEKGKSALSKVLESLCIHHQEQVLAMLKFLVQEQNAASLCCCNSSYTVSSESQNLLIEDDVDGKYRNHIIYEEPTNEDDWFELGDNDIRYLIGNLPDRIHNAKRPLSWLLPTLDF